MMPLYPSTSVTPSITAASIKGPDLPSVSNMEELSQMATQPNARYPYFDKNDDVFYIVSTNENNYKTISRYRFYEDPIPKPEDNYATKQEIMDLKGDIANVQQSLQQLIEQTKYRPKNKHGKGDVQNPPALNQPFPINPANGYDQSTAAVSVSNDISG